MIEEEKPICIKLIKAIGTHFITFFIYYEFFGYNKKYI